MESWKKILERLSEEHKYDKTDIKNFSKILEKLFPEKEHNLQKIAVALTLINNIVFITGGPGTGKTTTILKIISALIKNAKKKITIQLSAPTGKATERLTEILNNKSFYSFFPKKIKQKFLIL